MVNLISLPPSHPLPPQQVIFRQLWYAYAPRPSINAEFGQWTGPIWMDDVECIGTDQGLDLCPFNGCCHSKDECAARAKCVLNRSEHVVV